MLFEEMTKLDSGTLITTRRFPLEKTTYDKTTNLEQWKSLVNVIDTIATAFNFFLAGGFIANQVGRITLFGDIVISNQHQCISEDSPQDVAR